VRHRTTAGERILEAANATFLMAAAAVTLVPFIHVIAISFADPAETARRGFMLFPQTWTPISYRYLLYTNSFVRALSVTGFLAVAGTSLSLTVTSALSYALSRKGLTGRRAITLMVVLTMLFHPGFIPPYLLVRSLGLINSLWSLIIPVLTSAWHVVLLKGFFESLPQSLDEAASIDGCSEIGTWFRIILPLSAPALAAFGLFFAVAYWNTFFTAILYINDHTKYPLQVFLQNMLVDPSIAAGGRVLDTDAVRITPENLKMAAVVVATVPIVAVYPFLQRYFAKGVILGSIKE
jgi:putative aldouronate transport system permease protein